MTKEVCYAVRIGSPKHHRPYFMVADDTMIPRLFATRIAAEKAAPKQSHTRVVRVYVHDGRCAANIVMCVKTDKKETFHP